MCECGCDAHVTEMTYQVLFVAGRHTAMSYRLPNFNFLTRPASHSTSFSLDQLLTRPASHSTSFSLDLLLTRPASHSTCFSLDLLLTRPASSLCVPRIEDCLWLSSIRALRTMVLMTDLPPELISLLPNYLSSLDDWYALIRTSRYFYNACANTTARFPAVFQERDGRPFLRPHPHMLLSGIARQIGNWAVQSDANLNSLWKALDTGNVGLLALGAQVARLSVQDIRGLHSDKIEVVKPLAERVHRELRIQGLMRRRPFMPGLQATPELCVFNHVIYSELFHHAIDRILGRDGDQFIPPPIRHKWIELCMSSTKATTASSVGQDGVPSNSSGEHSLGSRTDSEDAAEVTIDFRDLIHADTWNSIWARLPFPDTEHSTWAYSALGHQGMHSLRLRLSLSNGDRQRLPSDVEEMIYKAVRFMTRREEAQGELPECFSLTQDIRKRAGKVNGLQSVA